MSDLETLKKEIDDLNEYIDQLEDGRDDIKLSKVETMMFSVIEDRMIKMVEVVRNNDPDIEPDLREFSNLVKDYSILRGKRDVLQTPKRKEKEEDIADLISIVQGN